MNIIHSVLHSDWSPVITNAEKLHLLNLSPPHAFGMTCIISTECSQTSYTAVFWVLSRLKTIDIIHV